MLESAGRRFVQAGSQFGLTVCIPKTKGLAMGAVSDGDVEVGSGTIEMVEGFSYLGSNLLVDCETTCEVKCQITKHLTVDTNFLIAIFLSMLIELFTML